jgi:cbb3-type cytochrome oxidase subunit 3
MSDTERKASKGMIKFVLTIFIIGLMIALAYLAFFTPGKAEQRTLGTEVSIR